MEVEIRPFEESMWQDLCDLVRLTYGPDYFMLDRRYFDWWYRDSPSNWEDGYRFLVATHGGKLIGLSGQIANAFRIRGKTYPGTWYTNGMIHPDYRGLGIGKKLYASATEFVEVAGAISYNAPACTLLVSAGFEAFGQRRMRRAIYLLRPGDAERYLPCADRATMSGMRKHFGRTGECLDQDVGLPVGELTAGFDTLWQRVRERYTVTTERTRKHISWRYLKHPAGRYHVIPYYSDGDNLTPAAVGVVRLESEEPTRVARIVDVWGSADSIEPLLGKLLGFAAREGAVLADFFCTSWPDREAFEKAGFYILDETRACCVPYLFSPVKSSTEYNEQIALWARDAAIVSGLGYEDVYFVRGDSDRDRPQGVEHAAPETAGAVRQR